MVVEVGNREERHQCRYHYDPLEHQCLDLPQANLVDYRAPGLGLYQSHHTNPRHRHHLADRDRDVVVCTEIQEEWDLPSHEEVVVDPVLVHSLGDHLDVEEGVDGSVCSADDNLSVVARGQGFPNPLQRQTQHHDRLQPVLFLQLGVAVDHRLLHPRQCETHPPPPGLRITAATKPAQREAT